MGDLGTIMTLDFSLKETSYSSNIVLIPFVGSTAVELILYFQYVTEEVLTQTKVFSM